MATLGPDTAVKFLTNSKEPPKWNATKKQYEKNVKKQHNKIMRYPMDIISASTDYLKIEILKHTGKGSGFGQGEMFTGSTTEIKVGQSGDKDVSIKGMKGGSVKEMNKTLHDSLADVTIMLPIPQNIGDSNSLDKSIVDPNSVKLIMYTSGTTGQPKGVLHSHNTIDTENQAFSKFLNLGAEDVILMPSPLTHITGYLYGIQLPIVLGVPVVLMETWNAKTAAELI